MEGWMDQSSTEKWWGAWGFQRRASVFAAKGIWYRISGQAILYLSALPSERVLHSTGSLLRAADASGEEVEKFRISSSTNGGMRRTFRFWGSDSGYGICWKDSCSPLAFSPPRKGHAWIPGVVLVRAQQKCKAEWQSSSFRSLDGVRCFLYNASDHPGFGSKYLVGWILSMKFVLCMEVLVLNNVSVAM